MQKLNTRRTKLLKRPTGKWAYEFQLINNLDIELQKLLTHLEVKPFTKREIMLVFKAKVTNKNIIRLHTHPTRNILYHLLNQSLSELETFTEINFITKTK